MVSPRTSSSCRAGTQTEKERKGLPKEPANPVASRCWGLRQACSIHASVVMATAASAKDNETRAVSPTVLPKSAAERLAPTPFPFSGSGLGALAGGAANARIVETNAATAAMAMTAATPRRRRDASRALTVRCSCLRAGRNLGGDIGAPQPTRDGSTNKSRHRLQDKRADLAPPGLIANWGWSGAAFLTS